MFILLPPLERWETATKEIKTWGGEGVVYERRFAAGGAEYHYAPGEFEKFPAVGPLGHP